LPFGFANESHCAVERGVITVRGVALHAVDDKIALGGEVGDLGVSVDAFLFDVRVCFRDRGFGV